MKTNMMKMKKKKSKKQRVVTQQYINIINICICISVGLE